MFEGMSFGAIGRDHAIALLAAIAAKADAASRAGVRACIALGCVGIGALGDEPLYASPTALREDVAVARAFGARDLALLDLGGVLARPPWEAWLDAVASESSERPLPHAALAPPSRRVRALLTCLERATHVRG
jgi:hypothetical protein